MLSADSVEFHGLADHVGWKEYLYNLGQVLASHQSGHGLAILTLPSVKFSVPFISLGFISQRLKSSACNTPALPVNSSAIGRSVLFKNGDIHVKAKVQNFTEVHGQQYFVIQYHSQKKGNSRKFVPVTQVDGLIPIQDKDFGEDYQMGQEIVFDECFLKKLFHLENSIKLSNALHSVNIVGQPKFWLHEIDSHVSASILGVQDLRLGDALLSTGQRNHIQFVHFYSPFQKIIPTINRQAGLNIFRGGRSFLKKEHLFKNGLNLIIIDYNDPDYDSVVSRYNQEYLSRSGNLNLPITSFLPGMQLSAYLKREKIV